MRIGATPIKAIRFTKLNSRTKGLAGRRRFRSLLEDRDWQVTSTADGIEGEDLLVTDPDGVVWACEVKDTVLIKTREHRTQAKAQAAKRKVRWMLANHIAGTTAWIIQQQGRRPTLWFEKESGDD